MSKKMFSRERERGKLRFSALLILIGLLLFGCDPTTVTITYNANGGEGEMKPQAVESGVEVKLNANTFTKDGSDFTGWNEAADGSGKAYADGATVAPTGNLTLYAQWQVKSTPENPGTEDPGTEDPGTEDPGTEDPGTEDPGTEDPESPVVLEDHITNLALIYVVEQTYPEFGWTKTAEGYVDMTNETNKTLVEGVTSLGPNGDMYLDGIEYFTGLQNLTLLNNSVLTELPDLTNLNKLQILSVTSCGLTAVSGLPASLEKLDLNTNKLTELNVSELTNLTYLDVSVNELIELNIDNNTKLTYLACYANRMTALNITNVEAFSQTSSDTPPILACGLQEDAEGVLQALTLIGTQEQKTALASFVPAPDTALEDLTELQKPNVGVAWFVSGEELGITAGTAVFDKTDGLTLPVEGQNLPEGATVSVYLGDNQVDSQHVSINNDRNAVIVALPVLTNGASGMTVTVTVAAEGYNSTYLSYEGVSTVWIPDNVTVTFDANAKIGGESVSVTISQADGTELSGVTIESGTYSVGQNAAETLAIGDDGLSFTAPILPDAEDTGTEVTVSLVLAKENADSVTVDGLTLTVYPETHVRYDGRIFQQVKGFDFSTENTAKTAGVTVKRGAGGTWAEKSNWETVSYSDGEGYTFTTNDNDGVRFVFPETDGDLDFELIMVETKWNNSNANIHLSWWYSNNDVYGYSFYKTGQSFFMVGGYNFAEGYGFNVDVTENTFNRFYAFDDGTNHSGRVNDGDVKSFSFSNTHTLDSSSSIQLEFNEGTSCTYTLRTVNFYKPVQ